MTTIEHLRSLLAKATPGRWVWDTKYSHIDAVQDKSTESVAFAAPVGDQNSELVIEDSDAELIAALVNAAPALLDVVEAACAWVDGHCSHDVKERIALRVAVDAIRAQEGK